MRLAHPFIDHRLSPLRIDCGKATLGKVPESNELPGRPLCLGGRA